MSEIIQLENLQNVFDDALDNNAEILMSVYKSYRKAGFSRKQAFDLVKIFAMRVEEEE